MKNRKGDFSIKIIYVLSGVMFFFLCIIVCILDMPIYIICIIFFSWAFLLTHQIRKCLIKFVKKFEQILDDMIEGKTVENQIFLYQDDLFSKIFEKLCKISSIHQHTKEVIENERDEIEKMVSDIAHQVKTPMTNVKIYQEILTNKLGQESEYKDILETIQSQVNKLDFLIQSVLKISQLEIGIIGLNIEKVSLRICLMKSLESVLLYAKRKNIEINVRDKTDLEVYCDIKWTSEALFNVLDNAIKYSSINSMVDISLQEIGIYSCISIQDYGIGIELNDLQNIFKRFYREKSTVYVDGVGIGLSLVREIIMKQGGYITVESTKGKGAKFSIYLPTRKFAVNDYEKM